MHHPEEWRDMQEATQNSLAEITHQTQHVDDSDYYTHDPTAAGSNSQSSTARPRTNKPAVSPSQHVDSARDRDRLQGQLFLIDCKFDRRQSSYLCRNNRFPTHLSLLPTECKWIYSYHANDFTDDWLYSHVFAPTPNRKQPTTIYRSHEQLRLSTGTQPRHSKLFHRNLHDQILKMQYRNQTQANKTIIPYPTLTPQRTQIPCHHWI